MAESSDRWLYRGEDGTEYGPYTSDEVRTYIKQNRISIRGWLKHEDSNSNWLPFSDAVKAFTLMPEILPGHPSADVPATVRIDPMHLQVKSETTEVGYIILATVFGVCGGLFGIHNLVAGYATRGCIQLALGIFGVWGSCIGAIWMGTLYLSIVIWLGLTCWVITEVMLVKKDSKGRPFKN